MDIETEQYSITPLTTTDATVEPTKTYYANYVLELANRTEPPVRKIHILSPNEYFQKQINLLKYKLVDLKAIAKHYHLHVSGTKPVLVERITDYYNKHKQATNIQRIFRAHLIRYSFRLRGPALKTRSCTNPSDFYTMEPLAEIPFERFFSYSDTRGFIYGFDIFSLLQLYKTKRELKNPYNRELLSHDTIQNLNTLKNITQIVFLHYVRDEWKQLYYTATNTPTPNFHQRRRMGIQSPLRRPPIEIHLPRPNYGQRTETIVSEPEITMPRLTPSPIQIESQPPTTGDNENVLDTPLESRVRNVFMEIDQLGNYTNVSWFLNMGINDCISFYLRYYELWRRHISTELRSCISPQRNPFNGTAILANDPTLEQCRMVCIQLIETMVYSGINIEYRRLGALHVLSVLARVSREAREALPWLSGIVFY
jgi:hypothetical protein